MGGFGRDTLLVGVAGAALLGTSPAWAQNTQANDDNGDILVLAAKLEESTPDEREKYGSRLEVVEGEAIDRGGYDDTAAALQMLVPGLYVSPQSGAFDYVNVSLLGSRSSEILFLVDGVRISNRLYSSTTPLDTLPASMIERIEVLKGGQGLHYGTQAVGGIVNVITKGFTHELDAVHLSNRARQPHAVHGMVVDDRHPDRFAGHGRRAGRQAWTRVPRGWLDRNSALPPSSSARSRIEGMPNPSCTRPLIPIPSSTMSMSTVSPVVIVSQH